MDVVTFSDISFGSNTYLAVNEEAGEAVLIDAGVSASKILDYLEDNNLELKAVLLTHGHPDHLLGLKGVVEATAAPCLHHQADGAPTS
ncbi:MAG: MBL fold metallo-hydrolase [Actinomycetota bacterium]